MHVEAVGQHGEHHRAEERADDRARAAEHRRAADDRRGHRVEHRLVAAGARVDHAGLEGDLQADERAEHAGDHEVAVLDPGDVDACLAGAELVAASRDRVQPPPGPGEDDVEDRHQANGPDDLGVGVAADPLADPDRVALGMLAWVALDVVSVIPSSDEARAEGGDERRQPERDGEESVDPADDQAHQQRSRSSPGSPGSRSRSIRKYIRNGAKL